MQYLIDLVKEHRMISDMSKKEFKSRFLGSYLGIFWAFIQPMMMIFIYWFVFQVGFRTSPVDDVPFILWLTAGIIPWFFFSESFSGATYSVLGNSYLVKKMVFKVHLLPIIKIISSFYIHACFLGLTYVVFLLYGVKPSIYHVQILYYEVALFLLVIGLSWITSALVIFLKDIGEIISIVLQIGFWMTPIFWSINIVPDKYLFLLKLNPMFYVVEGYRDSLIYQHWFWESPVLTLYFWGFTLGSLGLGILIFKRLRPHFTDIL